MTIPKTTNLTLPLLKLLKDGNERSMGEAGKILALDFGLTDDEKSELQKLGKTETKFGYQLAWSCTHLLWAELVERTRTAHIKITSEGSDFLKENPPELTENYLTNRFPKFAQRRRRGGSKLLVVENKDELKNAHDVFINSLTNLTTKTQTMQVSTRGGSDSYEINWIESLGIWWLTDFRTDGLSHWDCFGTDEPNWSTESAPSIKLEINTPTKGRNKGPEAQFVKNEKGEIFVCHTGNLHVQGRADERFYDVYSGPALWNEDIEFGDGSLRGHFLISKLSDPKSPEQIAEYVNAVNDYKISQKVKIKKNTENLFEAGHRLFLLEISQIEDKIPFENFDHVGFRKREVDWKIKVAENAKMILSLDKWGEWKPNPEKIFTAVKAASSPKIINQFGIWAPPFHTHAGYFDELDDQTKKEFGSQLFDFLKGKDTIEIRYDKLSLFLKEKRPKWGSMTSKLLTYLLFLTDSKKYFPIHPTNFTKLVDFFGKSVTKETSWKKYNSYLQLASELKLKLDEMYSTVLSVIEVQSYMWILAGAVSKKFLMVKAGEGGFDWENQKKLKIIGIHYLTIDLDNYLNKNNTISKKDVTKAWAEIHEKKSIEPFSKDQLKIKLGQLDRFHSIKSGDKIIAIGKNSELLGVGNATGGYKFRDDVGVHCHTVPVDWYDTDSREMPMQSMNITVKDLTARDYSDLMVSQGKTLPSIDTTEFEKILEHKSQLILYGPPGTGKTYTAKKIAESFTGKSFDDAQSPACFVATGAWADWEHTITNPPLRWGLKISSEEHGGVYKYLKEGDYVFLYQNKVEPVKFSKEGFFGIGIVKRKYTSDELYWPVEIETGSTSSALRFEIELVKKVDTDLELLPWIDGLPRQRGLNRITEGEPLTELFKQLKKHWNVTLQNCNFIKKITFHQSFSYEEFIEGIKAEAKGTNVSFNVEAGIFKEFCNCAKRNSEQKFVMIIDEINRGNISKILGELITLLEKDKREDTATLPYSKESFFVPKNVFIIGTMNTADRSLVLLDVALRRRFAFYEIMPDASLLKNKNIEGVNLTELLESINDKIKDQNMRDYQIGHSYFMEKENPIQTIDELKFSMVYEVIPLIREYFYNVPEKIKEILGPELSSDEPGIKWRTDSKELVASLKKQFLNKQEENDNAESN